VDVDLLPMMPKVWMAMRGNAVGVAMGNGTEATLAASLSAPGAKNRPFFYLAYDPVRWNRVVGQLGNFANAFAMDAEGGKLAMWVGVNKHGLEFGYDLIGR
jgi:hypothetical protein